LVVLAMHMLSKNKWIKQLTIIKKLLMQLTMKLTAPTYLYRAALALEQKGNKKEALELYKKVNIQIIQTSQEGMASANGILLN
jgi:hypothetical protein